MIKLVIGHSKSGKSSHIFDLMRRDAEDRRSSFLIVPEQQTVQSEQTALTLLPSSAQLTVEVLNFSRLANLVFRHYGGLSYNYADKGSKTLIMWKNLRELAPLLSEYAEAAGSQHVMSLASEMLTAVSELKAYCISPEKLESVAERISDNEILKNKLMDLSLIASAYSASLSESYSDSADDLSKLAEKLSHHSFFEGANVYIDSFTSFTAQEYRVIKEIMRSADNLTVTLTLDSVASSQIHYRSTADTALNLISLARSLSKEVEQISLDTADSLPKPLRIISESLWRPDVRDVEDASASENIRIISAQTPYDECDAVASLIRGLMMRGMRCREISVIARDASAYRGIIDVALEKAEIPYFFSQPTEILSKPLIKFILSALRIKIYNWRTEDIISYLKSGMLGYDRRSIDLLECYCSVWRISGASRFSEDFTMNPDGYSGIMTEAGKEKLAAINALKKEFVIPLNILFARLDMSESAEEMCRAIYSFMEENKIAEKLSEKAEAEFSSGRRREAAELLQLYNSTIKALDNIAASMYDSECSVSEFMDAMRIMLDNTSINTIPTAKDQVTVGSASMLRADGIKCAILIGLNEGEFPQNVKENGLFSNSDKKILENIGISLSPNTDVRSSEELFYVYRAMTIPTERLILCYHSNDLSGAAAAPSTAIARIRALYPTLPIENYEDLPLYDTVLSPGLAIEKLSRDKKSALGIAFREYRESHPEIRKLSFGADTPVHNLKCNIAPDTSNGYFHLTQTLIDGYVGCPFEYMCNQLLSLKEIRTASFDYSNFGTYIHYVFENYLKTAVRDGVIGQPPDQGYISRVIEDIAAEYLRISFPGGEANSNRLFHRFERMKRLARLVATSITSEFADSSFRPEFFELSVGRPHGDLSLAPLTVPTDAGKSIALTGKIDRVDLWRRDEDGSVFVRVIDYKSGKKKFNINNIEKGENLQLPIYLFALCDETQSAFPRIINAEGGVIPAGAMYLSSLVSPIDMSTDIDILKKAESSISRSGFIVNDMSLLSGMSHGLDPQYLCNTKINKDGTPSGKALIDSASMDEFKNTLRDTVKMIGEKMILGRMSCAPSFSSGKCHCESCAMRSVCRSAKFFLK